MKLIKVFAIGLTLLAAPAFADGHAIGNAEDGKFAFKKCKACHAIIDAEGEVIAKGGTSGPNLYGLYARQAASQAEYKKFDRSLLAAGEAGLTWNEADFVTYVADPNKFLKSYLDDKKAKSKMSYKLKKEQDAKDIWAFILASGPEIEAAVKATETEAEDTETPKVSE